MEKKLYRDEHRKVLGGVCAGLADYFDMDIAIVRALFLLTFIFMGTGFMVYIVLWIVLPRKDYSPFNPHVDYRVPPQEPFNPFTGNVPPMPGSPVKKQGATNAGLIIGVILIFIGGSFLLHELHIFRLWHLGKLWPAILVIVGFAIMASGNRRKPWERENWQNADTKEEIKDDTLNKDESFTKNDDSAKDNPPTV
ncbi:PspC domain-containing protein [Mucilaginibacter sabulilitoris]|uniref:PspC domain-containing protein n=1 Tax=Mucilaginibacter sabulilitoris TaxID=1173583 RepID=A0ABZ0TJK6_9SPHI|nr:PspC domain-containing protein [Mucilaginibacter sabulilitoris]WPU93344.1 PspC domain-containing protein [Mucilaginibacter sabulilitoris]